MHDRDTGTTQRISVSSTNVQANNFSYQYTLSADDQFIALYSRARNLVLAIPMAPMMFLCMIATGVSRSALMYQRPTKQADDQTGRHSISADGRLVVFRSLASNLIAGDSNGVGAIFVTENSLLKLANGFSVSLRTTSGATQVGEYIRFRARLQNNSNTTLTNCNAQLVNPLINFQHEFSYYSWPLNVTNPVQNGVINIAPGETGKFNLAILPRVAMRSLFWLCL